MGTTFCNLRIRFTHLPWLWTTVRKGAALLVGVSYLTSCCRQIGCTIAHGDRQAKTTICPVVVFLINHAHTKNIQLKLNCPIVRLFVWSKNTPKLSHLDMTSKHLKGHLGLPVCKSVSESFTFWVKRIKARINIGRRPTTCFEPRRPKLCMA